MKRALAIGALALMGCTTKTERVVYVPQTDNETVPATVKATTPTTPRTPTAEEQFIRDIEDSYGTVYNEQDVISVGRQTCTTLRNGATAYDILDAIASTGGDEFVTVVVASAIANFCPDQSWKFNT